MQSDAKKLLKETLDLKDVNLSYPPPMTNKLVDSIIMRDDSNQAQKLKDSKEGMKSSDAMMKASNSIQDLRNKYLEEWSKMN